MRTAIKDDLECALTIQKENHFKCFQKLGTEEKPYSVFPQTLQIKLISSVSQMVLLFLFMMSRDIVDQGKTTVWLDLTNVLLSVAI